MNLTCPSCGSSLGISVGLVSTVCPYCNTISMIDRNNLVSTGEKSFIMPFPTVFEVGKYFFAISDLTSNDKIGDKKVLYIGEEEYNKNYTEYLAKFYVYGQVRYTSDGGFFDDFFVRIIDDKFNLDKNKQYILGENEGLINLFFIKKIHTDVPQNVFESSVGGTWNSFFVQENGTTTIEGFNGSFPFVVSVKDSSKYITLLKDGKQTQLKSIGNDVLEYSGV
ncbi:MAG: hypothetical protein PHE25_02715 [Candidatus Gracilibacteria bacterium]|nr:hypothetical protein [Candidatus Gracilibacteria bacterium]